MTLQKVLSRVRQAVEDYHMIEEGDRIAVGISGGKDSLTLLLALNELRKFYPQKFSIYAVTVDLGFQNLDLNEIRALCASHEIPYTVVETSIAKIVFEDRRENNPCSLCAKMRKGALNDAIKDLGCNKIAYAHHEDTVIKTYCRNEMVNSVLSIYNMRFEEQRIRWEIQVSIGEKLPCSEMMFCAILSNVLENAMHAVQELPEDKRYIELSLSEKAGHLLLMEKNTVRSVPTFADGVPVTERSGHGLGARSIVYYVEKLSGQYQFFMEDGDFVVRIIL